MAWYYTICIIPSNVTYEGVNHLLDTYLECGIKALLTHPTEASTIPFTALTASLALYHMLNLPPPWSPTSTPIPLLLYGGSTAVGAFAIKLANISNVHPIITIAGRGKQYVFSLLDFNKRDNN